jgi:hypothetical protein
VRQDSSPQGDEPQGEVVHAKKWERMVQELRLKVWVYNLLPTWGLDQCGGRKVYNGCESRRRNVDQQSRENGRPENDIRIWQKG